MMNTTSKTKLLMLRGLRKSIEVLNLKPSAFNFQPNKERGQSLTELAVSMTFILILLAGVVDLGRAFFTYITLRDATQEGAAYGSYQPGSCTDIIARARQTSNSPINLVGDPQVRVSCSVTQACFGGEVTVTATYRDFPITMPFLGVLIGRQMVDISASATDDVLRPIDCP